MKQSEGDEGDTKDISDHLGRLPQRDGASRLSRRGYLGLLGGTGLSILTSGGASASTVTESTGGMNTQHRVLSEFFTRQAYSAKQLIFESDTSPHARNGRLSDEAVVSKYGKSLEHDAETGLPTTDAYTKLVDAVETAGEEVGYDEIPKAYENETPPQDIELSDPLLVDGTLDSLPLEQPESAWTYMTEGGSTAQLRIAVPPAFDDPEMGAEMVELYWRALIRDVDFRDFGESSLVQAAADELDSLDAYSGPGADGTVTPDNVFRGVVPGATAGPYVSQFLWKDRDLGTGSVDQRMEPQIAENTPADYVTTVEDWRKIQDGVYPGVVEGLPGNEYASERRYIINGRDLCERVHIDPPFRQIQYAAQVLILTINAPLDEGIPYTLSPRRPTSTQIRGKFNSTSPSRRNVGSFLAQTTFPTNDFGTLYIEKKALQATEHGLKAAWHKKWNVHRRLRPEEYGGRVQAVKGDSDDLQPNGYSQSEIPSNLLSSAALARTKETYGSYLLPQAYAEGSPTHPSYPAGHAVVAGAGVTVLKALFDGGFEFPHGEKVVPTRDGSELLTAAETDVMGIDETLTVRGELNKLAWNMALGRNFAGIHYRSDGIEGLRLGESAAIRFMEDHLSLPKGVSERVTLDLETFDGESITISPTV